jgi:hypothetical protein
MKPMPAVTGAELDHAAAYGKYLKKYPGWCPAANPKARHS